MAAAVGLKPADLRGLSLWEFTAFVEGFGAANGWKMKSEPQDVSDERLAAMGIQGFT